FTTSGPAYWKPKTSHLMGYNLPHYIYEDSPFFKKIASLKRIKWKLKGKVVQFYTRRDAQAYVTQTDDVNQRLRKWIKSDNVFTVSNTYGSHFNHKSCGKPFLPERKNGE